MDISTPEVSNKTDKRNELIQRAFSLFYEQGFHATGVDTVLSGTGISKRTLYKYFSSKEELIVSAIQYYHQTNLQLIDKFIAESGASSPQEKILALFDFLAERVNRGDFRGCLVINAKAEYAQTVPDISSSCKGYTDAIEGLLQVFLLETGLKNTPAISKQIGILFSGSVEHCKLVGNAQPVFLAKEVVGMILKAAE